MKPPGTGCRCVWALCHGRSDRDNGSFTGGAERERHAPHHGSGVIAGDALDHAEGVSVSDAGPADHAVESLALNRLHRTKAPLVHPAKPHKWACEFIS